MRRLLDSYVAHAVVSLVILTVALFALAAVSMNKKDLRDGASPGTASVTQVQKQPEVSDGH